MTVKALLNDDIAALDVLRLIGEEIRKTEEADPYQDFVQCLYPSEEREFRERYGDQFDELFHVIQPLPIDHRQSPYVTISEPVDTRITDWESRRNHLLQGKRKSYIRPQR